MCLNLDIVLTVIVSVCSVYCSILIAQMTPSCKKLTYFKVLLLLIIIAHADITLIP